MVLFLDTNILIDFFDRRETSADAEAIFSFCSEDENQGIIASLSVSILFYVLRKKLSVNQRKEHIRSLVELFQVGSIDRDVVSAALDLDMKDFEDAMQAVCAQRNRAEWIISNNGKDFLNSPVPVISSSEFVKKYCASLKTHDAIKEP